MLKRKFLILIFSMMVISIIGNGCSSNENENALKDESGKTVHLDNKEQPTLLFFFTGIG
ncbi:hypothetical protein [Neobacillus niacini]|uniref:hypothetical protein n=1 Tax=Neobacillus niacini TaxID=86668 RepID=UPI0021CB583B|nr:hypothetical protein [Neobacillus niacini]MCM3764577.1 hypothetical protein [Neobacillus niacini]